MLQRMDQARILLHTTNDSIEEIAAAWRDSDGGADLPDEAKELLPETPEEGFSEEQ